MPDPNLPGVEHLQEAETAPDASGFVEVGASYCTVHDGLMNEDDDRCDFAVGDIETGDTHIEEDEDGEPFDTGEPRPCEGHQLYMRSA